MQPPSVHKPELATDVCRQMVLVAEREVQEIGEKRHRLMLRLKELDRQLAAAEQKLLDLRDKYDAVAAGGDVSPDLLPDGAVDAKREVAKKYTAEQSAHRGRDEADLLDLQHRLKGSRWRVYGQPKRRGGSLRVALVNTRKSRSREDFRDEADQNASRAAATFADRYTSGAFGLTPLQLTEMPETTAERFVAERWGALSEIGVIPPARATVQDQRDEQGDFEDREKQQE